MNEQEVNRRNFIKLTSWAAVLMWVGTGALAQTDDESRLDRWNALSPEERQHIRARWEEFKKLPLADQDRLKKAYQRFMALPPERRDIIKANFERYQKLSKEAQERVAKLFKVWEAASPSEKQEIRRKFEIFQRLSPAERTRLREKYRHRH